MGWRSTIHHARNPMNDKHARLRAVLLIAHDVSYGGEGISLNQALERADYLQTRQTCNPDDLLPLLERDLELVDLWLTYSEDKRTSGGWYLTREGEVGRVEHPEETMHFERIEQAVAEFVVRELDYWTSRS